MLGTTAVYIRTHELDGYLSPKPLQPSNINPAKSICCSESTSSAHSISPTQPHSGQGTSIWMNSDVIHAFEKKKKKNI